MASNRGDLDDVPGLLPAHRRQRGAGHVDHTKQVGFDLGAEILGRELLERADVSEARVVDQNIETAEGNHRHLHGRLRRHGIRNVERDRAYLIAIPGDEIGKLFGITRGGHEAIPGSEYGLGDIASQTTSATRN
jgi:hypothetical protein